MRRRVSADGGECLDAEMAEIAKTVFCDCGADGGEGFVIACVHGRDCVSADGVVKGSVGGGACLDAEMHDEGEPLHDCDEMAILVGGVGVGLGHMLGDPDEGHVGVLVADAWSASDPGWADDMAGDGEVGAVSVESWADVQVPEPQASMQAGDAGSNYGCNGSAGIAVDADGRGTDRVLRLESHGNVG